MQYSKQIIETIREQKKKATPSELLMIQKLKFRNIAFQFQYPVLTEESFFTADFFIPKYGVIIEVDGGCHETKQMRNKDFIKDLLYESLGYNVIRIKNKDVDTFNTLLIKNYKRKKIINKIEPVVDFRKKRIKLKEKNKRCFN